jgi:hypothetical protein
MGAVVRSKKPRRWPQATDASLLRSSFRLARASSHGNGLRMLSWNGIRL